MRQNLTESRLPRPAADEWRAYLEEWDRALRARNRPRTTRYNYELAVTQLADFLAGAEAAEDPAYDQESVASAADDPGEVERAHVEMFIAWMIRTRSPSTALNKYKGVQQFFNYLHDEGEVTAHPMARMHQPETGEELIPLLTDDQLAALLATCAGKSFLDRRDTALIRLLLDTGGRLTEVTTLSLDTVSLDADCVTVLGKGNRQRVIPFGAKTGQALARYLRVRARHPAATRPELFVAARGIAGLAPDAVKTMLRRRGAIAGIENLHAHRFRHTLAHTWRLQGGSETDLMAVMGWTSEEMLRRYGKSAAHERAQHSHRTLALGDRV